MAIITTSCHADGKFSIRSGDLELLYVLMGSTEATALFLRSAEVIWSFFYVLMGSTESTALFLMSAAVTWSFVYVLMGSLGLPRSS